jgi:hypothetical protein
MKAGAQKDQLLDMAETWERLADEQVRRRQREGARRRDAEDRPS